MRRLLPSVLLFAAASYAQKPAAPAANEPVLMLSDIHLDPFHDPTLVPQLVAAKVTDWAAILARPGTAASQQAYVQLQKTCKATGVDTDYALFASSVAAERAQQPKPLFVTVSGDLMAHQFDCRFKTLVPKGTEQDYSDFAAKTVAFVAQQLHAAFSSTPIYFSLGNNDSSCKDYRENSGSSYLSNDGKSLASVVLDKANAADIAAEFSAYGDYNVRLPKPFKETRLLVMQDIFESKKYATCDGRSSTDAGAAQIAWLRKQLDAARRRHERVWVMTHMPAGIDAYTTIQNAMKEEGAGCRYTSPVTFLGSDLFADALRDYTDVVALVLLGHTHMDEMRLYTAKTGGGAIPGKLVPSISPVVGNNPSFTIGMVDAAKAMLVDYTVYAASNQTGVETTWTPEYTYSSTYGQPDYSAASVAALTEGFFADPESKSAQTRAYEKFYYVSGPGVTFNLRAAARAAALTAVWPVYACSITKDYGGEFTDCACPGR